MRLMKFDPPPVFASLERLPRVTGPWSVDVKKAGQYRLILRQFPKEAGQAIKAVRAKIQIFGKEQESVVETGVKGVIFELGLPEGKTELWTWLYDAEGKAGGAYFTEVEAL